MAVAVRRNKLLLALPSNELEAIRGYLEPVPLKLKRILHHAKLPIDRVYFVESGLISVVAPTDQNNSGIEAWLIGHEGMAGVPAVLGEESSPHKRMVQADGSALQMSVADLHWAMESFPSFRAVLLRYVHSVLIQSGQLAACNARHALSQRCARWILMVHDRMAGDDLPLTHDIVAKMIGVRRAGVTNVVGKLARTGAIEAGRGHIWVRDRRKLEKQACSCYRVMKSAFDHVAVPVDAPTWRAAEEAKNGSLRTT